MIEMVLSHSDNLHARAVTASGDRDILLLRYSIAACVVAPLFAKLFRFGRSCGTSSQP